MINPQRLNKLEQKLKQQHELGLTREQRLWSNAQGTLREGKTTDAVLSFCSNDYLGLANHPKVKESFCHGVEQYGVGSGSSHMIAGHTQAHHDLETALAQLAGQDDALLFSTGYMANLGVLSTLCERGDLLLQDKHNHASLIDGGLLSRATSKRYATQDMQQLQQLLEQHHNQQAWVVSDGIFSMQGCFAPLPDLLALCEKHTAGLIIDDAHGFGVVGPAGSGTLGSFNCASQVSAVVGTLGKAFGTAGAFVAGPSTIIKTLRQFARTYRYTTAPPPALAVASLTSVQLSLNEAWRREHLQTLIAHWKELAEHYALPCSPSDTPIQVVRIGDNYAAMTLSEKLLEQGIYVHGIRPPTVPEGEACLRITLTALHQPHHLKQCAKALDEHRHLFHNSH